MQAAVFGPQKKHTLRSEVLPVNISTAYLLPYNDIRTHRSLDNDAPVSRLPSSGSGFRYTQPGKAVLGRLFLISKKLTSATDVWTMTWSLVRHCAVLTKGDDAI